MKLTVSLLCAAIVFAQLPPRQTVTIFLANTPTPEGVKEMMTLTRFVAQVADVSYDQARNSFSLTGFEHQLGLAQWLLRAAESPAVNTEYLMQPDLPADNRDPVTRVHYLRNSDRASYQEILTVARTVGDIQLASGGDQPPMIAFRGTAAQVELGEWLAASLDVPTGAGSSSFALPSADGAEDIVRIFFLYPGMNRHAILELRDKIRAATNAKRIFNKTSPPALIMRGTSSVLSQAQQLIGQN